MLYHIAQWEASAEEIGIKENKNEASGTEGMAQCVKHLWCKHEVKSSDPQHYVKSRWEWQPAGNPSTQEDRDREFSEQAG